MSKIVWVYLETPQFKQPFTPEQSTKLVILTKDPNPKVSLLQIVLVFLFTFTF